MQRVRAVLTERRRPARHAPTHAAPFGHRLYTVRQAPPTWSPAASTGRRPAAYLPRAAAWPQVLVEDASPVRPYVLSSAERARFLGGGAL
ncbi:hypothetical protein RND61_13820 [Streptomyces sp. TRM76323]|uniref:Uncharacterized protein n=1 Tax=Streptomyces tamarix TaxID=3078565 RepID=A0ABU3QK53_9ACTN|nr:hypothetical protein [Streptomyces tamarix]MDT9683142.1 hypothetical protein [Streptomyces tamarix]